MGAVMIVLSVVGVASESGLDRGVRNEEACLPLPDRAVRTSCTREKYSQTIRTTSA